MVNLLNKDFILTYNKDVGPLNIFKNISQCVVVKNLNTF